MIAATGLRRAARSWASGLVVAGCSEAEVQIVVMYPSGTA
jgi:hypothetical protein